MANIKVAIWNRSTVLTDAQVNAAVPPLQTQVHRDFAAAWGTDADLTFVDQNSSPAPGMWWLLILDDAEQAGYLGYHDITAESLPQGKVFANTDLQNNLQWTGTASHELLEMLADPEINLAAFVPIIGQGAPTTLYAYEVCDACEADQYGYNIDGTAVSDFVFPAWFESSRPPGSTQFDYTSNIDQPFKLLPGGYSLVFDITSGTGWQQITAEAAPKTYQMRAPVGSRRERRRTPRHEWLNSNPKPAKRKR